MLLRCLGALNSSKSLTTPLRWCSRRSPASAHIAFRGLASLEIPSAQAVSEPHSTTHASHGTAYLKEVSDVAFQEQISRSFVKVPLPAEAVLRQIVVAAPEEQTDLYLRAYHVGSRIHIGRVLASLSQAHPSCRTNAGKDYAIIWLDDIPVPVYSSTALTVRNVVETFQWLQRSFALPVPPSWVKPEALERMVALRQLGGEQHPSDSTAAAAPAKPAWNLRQFMPQSKQLSELVTVTRPGSATAEAAAPPVQLQLQPPPQPHKQLQPPFMAVYRSGSVVFGGLPEREELLWLSHLVPPAVRYSGDNSKMWATSKGRSVPTVMFQESLKVVIDASCPAYAAQGDDEVQLRVLDVGGVRVLTSVLAQSAALKFYEESVKQSLEQLANWRAAHSLHRAGFHGGVWGSGYLRWFRDVLLRGSKQDKVLFKVIATSALIINEAQQLLEVAEPAWQYDTYNKIWELMAKDQQLEARLTNLETKLHQVETEAKHDVKARAGRRSRRLDQGIILLLFVSCVLAAFEAGITIRHHKAGSSSSDSAETCKEGNAG